MAGRGMGMATRGGGCVGSGPRNKVIKETSKTTGPVMMATGGDVKKKKKKGFPDLVRHFCLVQDLSDFWDFLSAISLCSLRP